jgi:uncharacterized membrane protein YcaP (DUF421 family)
MMTKDDLIEQLREQGVEDIRGVKKCYLESDGRISVIRYDSEPPSHRIEKRRA